MPDEINPSYCPEDLLADRLAALGAAPEVDATALDDLLRQYAKDPRLHFLKGSFLAGARDYAGAKIAMRSALDLAPGFEIARFQLGFLQLTSGEPVAAQETWGPLYGLPDGHYLQCFMLGLIHLVRDEFSETIRQLELGMAHNTENPPLNEDMRLIIKAVKDKMAGDGEGQGEMSSAQALLQQAALRSTMH